MISQRGYAPQSPDFVFPLAMFLSRRIARIISFRFMVFCDDSVETSLVIFPGH